MSTMDTVSDEAQERASNKLRFSEPDLVVVLQYSPEETNEEAKPEESEDSPNGEEEEDAVDPAGDSQANQKPAAENDGDDDEKENKRDDDKTEAKMIEKEYTMYSQVLAKHSTFIDTTLSVNMKEKDTKTIVFKNVLPETFEKALLYLEDPEAARDAEPEDVMQVVEFYHLYDFTQGLGLADRVLSDYFDSVEDSDGPPKDLDFLVDTVCLVFRLRLPRAMESGASCIDSITQPFLLKCANPWIFTQDHIKKLQPLFVEKELELPNCVDVSEDELASSLFPKHFVTCVASLQHSCKGKPQLRIKFEAHKSEVTLVSRAPRAKLRFGKQVLARPTSRFWATRTTTHDLDVDGWKVKLSVERVQRGEGGHDEDYLGAEQKNGDWCIFVYPCDGSDKELPPHPVFWFPYSSHLEFPNLECWKKLNDFDDDGTEDILRNPTLSYVVS